MRHQLWRRDNLLITRGPHGIPQIEGADQRALWWGMGFCHATDRGLQMLLTRILGRGELSRLAADDTSLALDKFFARGNWRSADAAVTALSPRARELAHAYCAGANAAFARRLPWELRLLGYRHTPWTLEDIILIIRIVGYVSLAELQNDIERLVVELVQAGVGKDKIEELFPGRIDGLDEVSLRQVRLGERLIPEAARAFTSGMRLGASNNWVVSGARTRSGKPILCNDPHLEVSRLPSIWSEIALKTPTRWGIGASMPGLPALLIGRTNDLAWGATYSCMDAIDSWIERCQNGSYEREGSFVPFRQRREIIQRKGLPPVECVFYENDHGVLDGDPHQAGLYLTTRWTGADMGAESIDAAAAIWDAPTAEDGMKALGRIEVAINWVLADRKGNIGYQMSGRAPLRRQGVSGLVPLPGWDPQNDWQGLARLEDLPRTLNPPEGFIVTANHDLNHLGKVRPINVCAGPWRPDRIADLLRRDDLDVEAMKQVHHDLHSRHAVEMMELLRPLLPQTPQGRLLRDWDCSYGAESKGAFLFEKVYQQLRHEILAPALGETVVDFLASETHVLLYAFSAFDRVLRLSASSWLGKRSRDEIWRAVAETALRAQPRAWGEHRRVMLRHLLFGGKLPRFLGFDRGPIVLEGGGSTVHVGEIFRSGGRDTTFAPSFRFITDMAEDAVHSSLAGGPSDRRFSRWYASDLGPWQAGEYKRLTPVA